MNIQPSRISKARFARLKSLLDSHYHAYNRPNAISQDNPDPLLVVYKYARKDSRKDTSPACARDSLGALDSGLDSRALSAIALVCALFAYGNVRAIVKFLDALPLDRLGQGAGQEVEQEIGQGAMQESKQGSMQEYFARFPFPYYRFQSSEDVKLLFLSLSDIVDSGGLEQVLDPKRYSKPKPLEAIARLITLLYQHAARVLGSPLAHECFSQEYRRGFVDSGRFSRGFRFLIGNPIDSTHIHGVGSSPLKRWNMLLRWLVRSDAIDLGLWQGLLAPSDLLLPLDTHTHRISRELGLLNRASYDLRAVLEVSQTLGRFCPHDPIRYDFALYRIGQEQRAKGKAHAKA